MSLINVWDVVVEHMELLDSMKTYTTNDSSQTIFEESTLSYLHIKAYHLLDVLEYDLNVENRVDGYCFS